ncbi:uncharacterized protein LOC127354162 [Dicentrarchus labrax]|uniref:uncharacterized protein LOC127354162 n=1 Tax=Dicentrarchus labrax TaxID=13489 RepID=UPI0021F69450|nr:uncharacterized protein LOC127354162 [Dicentrarchus labrax]
MPQNDMNYEGRRRGMRYGACKANGQVSGHVPHRAVVNGAVVDVGSPDATARTSKRTPAGPLNGAKPQCMVNGYINHGCKGKSVKAPPPRTLRKQGSTNSAVTDASAARCVSSAGIPRSIAVNGDTSLDAVALPSNSDQKAPEPSPSAAAKKPRRWKKFLPKMRTYRTEDNQQDHCRASTMPPQEEEDWEKEIQEVTLTDWEKMCFGNLPYGPEDLLHFSLRDLTLKQRDTGYLPVTANYSPTVHHPRPVRWSSYNMPTVPEQFADADE